MIGVAPHPAPCLRPVPLVTGLVILITFGFRYLSLGSFENDHFVHLALAQQMLLGEVPLRDFDDPGMPLMYVASAVAQAALGQSLFAEAVLAIAGLAIGAAITLVLAARVSPIGIALFVTYLQVAAYPRLYNYPKILIYAVGILAMWRYTEWPGWPRLVVVALVTAGGFLFRHDHGVYLSVASIALLVTVHWTEGWRRISRFVAVYLLLVAVVLAPWAVFVHRYMGLGPYLKSGFEFSRVEAMRTGGHWPGIGLSGPLFTDSSTDRPIVRVLWMERVTPAQRADAERRFQLESGMFDLGRTWRYRLRDTSLENVNRLVNDPAVEDTHGVDREQAQAPEYRKAQRPAKTVVALYYVLMGLPIVAIALVLRRHVRRGRELDVDGELPSIICAAVLFLLVDVGFLRDQLSARLPDVFAPAAVVGAWLIAQSAAFGRSGATAWLSKVVVVAACALTGAAVLVLGDARAQVFETHVLTGPLGMARHAASLTRELRAWPWQGLHPNPEFLPLAEYLNACTRQQDRVLVGWFAPETYVFANRGFAGGHPTFVFGYYTSNVDQARTIARIRPRRAPLVLLRASDERGFAAVWPLVYRYLMDHYKRTGLFETSSGVRIEVFTPRGLAPVRTYGHSSLPCFR